jgi:hypothetical protein
VPERILMVTKAWIDSLGPAAALYFPIDRLDSPFRIGVRIRGNFVETAWSSITPHSDDVLELTSAGSLARNQSEWHTVNGVGVRAGAICCSC